MVEGHPCFSQCKIIRKAQQMTTTLTDVMDSIKSFMLSGSTTKEELLLVMLQMHLDLIDEDKSLSEEEKEKQKNGYWDVYYRLNEGIWIENKESFQNENPI